MQIKFVKPLDSRNDSANLCVHKEMLIQNRALIKEHRIFPHKLQWTITTRTNITHVGNIDASLTTLLYKFTHIKDIIHQKKVDNYVGMIF